MAFNINSISISNNLTNYNINKNLTNTQNSLSRISSGLRINKASDDSSGLMIADSLRTQANSLNQAQKNINDAMGIINIADKAMNEQTQILDKIKTKLIQSANDTQTNTTRKAIDNDVTKLLKSFQNITNTTSYNGQNLLSGLFDNKKFQIGANANETISMNIQSNSVSKVGSTSFKLGENLYATDTYTGFGDVSLSFKDTDGLHDVDLESVTIGSGAGEGLGALADVINKNSDKTGVKATAEVIYTTSVITQGTTSKDFSINGITIGSIDVNANDSNGALVNAINNQTDKTGVIAWTSEKGELNLKSDGRAIVVDSGSDGLKLSSLSSSGVITNERGDDTYMIENGEEKIGVPIYTTPSYMFTIKAGTERFKLEMTLFNGIYSSGGIHLFTKSGEHLTGSVPPETSWATGVTPDSIITNNPDLFDSSAVYSNEIRPANTPHTYNGTNIDEDYGIAGFNISNITEDLLVFANCREVGERFSYRADYSGTGGNIAIGQLQLTKEGTSAQIDISGTNLDKIGLSDTNNVTDYHKNLSDITAISDEISDTFSIQDSISIVDSAIMQLDKNRANLGSTYNQLASSMNNISTTYINLKSSESNIRDVDFADEYSTFQKTNILTQAGNFAFSINLKNSKDNITKLLQ